MLPMRSKMMAMSGPSILLLTIDWVPGRDVRGPWPLQLPSSLYLPFLFIPSPFPLLSLSPFRKRK